MLSNFNLKTLVQKILVGFWVKSFTFSILSLLSEISPKLFLRLFFELCTIVFRADIGNNRKIVNFKYSCFYARPVKVVSADNSLRYYFKKQIKVNFEWKFKSIPVKSVLCILKIHANYKLPLSRTKFLKLKFWKLLSNS